MGRGRQAAPALELIAGGRVCGLHGANIAHVAGCGRKCYTELAFNVVFRLVAIGDFYATTMV